MKASEKNIRLGIFFLIATFEGGMTLWRGWDAMVGILKVILTVIVILCALLVYYFVSEYEIQKKIEDDNDKKMKFYNGD